MNAADHSALEILTIASPTLVHSVAFTFPDARRRDLQTCCGVTIIVRRYTGKPRQDPSEPYGLISKL